MTTLFKLPGWLMTYALVNSTVNVSISQVLALILDADGFWSATD